MSHGAVRAIMQQAAHMRKVRAAYLLDPLGGANWYEKRERIALEASRPLGFIPQRDPR